MPEEERSAQATSFATAYGIYEYPARESGRFLRTSQEWDVTCNNLIVS